MFYFSWSILAAVAYFLQNGNQIDPSSVEVEILTPSGCLGRPDRSGGRSGPHPAAWQNRSLLRFAEAAGTEGGVGTWTTSLRGELS